MATLQYNAETDVCKCTYSETEGDGSLNLVYKFSIDKQKQIKSIDIQTESTYTSAGTTNKTLMDISYVLSAKSGAVVNPPSDWRSCKKYFMNEGEFEATAEELVGQSTSESAYMRIETPEMHEIQGYDERYPIFIKTNISQSFVSDWARTTVYRNGVELKRKETEESESGDYYVSLDSTNHINIEIQPDVLSPNDKIVIFNDNGTLDDGGRTTKLIFSQDWEYDHVTVSSEEEATPTQDYVITIDSLDEGYSLDLNNSKVTFCSGNATKVVTLDKCTIDTANSTITVPGALVTDQDVDVSIVSEKKQSTMTKEEQIAAINRAIDVQYGTNNTWAGNYIELQSGTGAGESSYDGTISWKIADRKAERIVSEGQDESKQFYIPQDDNIGFWFINSSDRTNWIANPCIYGGIKQEIATRGLTLSELLEGATYNDVTNEYTTSWFGPTNNQIRFSFVYDWDKQLKNLVEEVKYINGTVTEIIKISLAEKDRYQTKVDDLPQTYTKQNVFTDDDFEEESGVLKATTAARMDIKVTDLTVSAETLSGFDASLKTYLYFDNDSIYDISKDCLINIGGQQKAYGNGWSISTGDKKYIVLDENVITGKLNLVLNYANGSGGTFCISQTEPA